MNKELQDKLFKEFPLLYGDRNKPMTHTAMCWGLSCDDGWYDLIRDLSSKLEPLIEKIRDQNRTSKCFNCSCPHSIHVRTAATNTKPCLAIHRLPFRVKGPWTYEVPDWKKSYKNYGLIKGTKRYLKNDWKKTKYRATRRINKILGSLFAYTGFGYNKPCHCKDYEIDYPRASQVKEKYGTLSFYMTHGTDEIFDLIGDAERKSAKVCEDCGKKGKLRTDRSWIKTLCSKCDKK